jgi:predicted ribosome quality control (RQC) complex YloA/Tae2 family protein
MIEEILECDGLEYVIWIGKNEEDNFEIIDNSRKKDVWFHVVGMPSCHVILKTEENVRDIPRKVLKRCGYLCKINSKGKSLSKCDIVYTTIDNVKKTNIIGKVEISNGKIIRC